MKEGLGSKLLKTSNSYRIECALWCNAEDVINIDVIICFFHHIRYKNSKPFLVQKIYITDKVLYIKYITDKVVRKP